MTPVRGRWYVTASHVRVELATDGPPLRPVSLAHAKEQGTLTTACGLWADSWRKMMDLPFPVPRGRAPGVEMCPRCRDRVMGVE